MDTAPTRASPQGGFGGDLLYTRIPSHPDFRFHRTLVEPWSPVTRLECRAGASDTGRSQAAPENSASRSSESTLPVCGYREISCSLLDLCACAVCGVHCSLITETVSSLQPWLPFSVFVAGCPCRMPGLKRLSDTEKGVLNGPRTGTESRK